MIAPLMLLAIAVASASSSRPAQPNRRLTDLERSYWVHASLGWKPHKGYWGMAIAASPPPTEVEVRNAAQLLTGQYAANRLTLSTTRRPRLQKPSRSSDGGGNTAPVKSRWCPLWSCGPTTRLRLRSLRRMNCGDFAPSSDKRLALGAWPSSTCTPIAIRGRD